MLIFGWDRFLISTIFLEYNRHGGCVTFKDEDMENHRSFSGDDANNNKVEESR